MESQPVNLVNSFPNTSRLEMDREAGFIAAMRNPATTKAPYSLFDNDSNTFARQGNTDGPEQQKQPQINQDDYFNPPRPTLIRQPQKVSMGSYSDYSAVSPINRIGGSSVTSDLTNEFDPIATPSFNTAPGNIILPAPTTTCFSITNGDPYTFLYSELTVGPIR